MDMCRCIHVHENLATTCVFTCIPMVLDPKESTAEVTMDSGQRTS